jgi:hypothetical protein
LLYVSATALKDILHRQRPHSMRELAAELVKLLLLQQP